MTLQKRQPKKHKFKSYKAKLKKLGFSYYEIMRILKRRRLGVDYKELK